MSEPATILRFDVFELDTGSGELRRNGDRIKLPPQPFRVLELLVRRGGEVLTRADIRERIWCDSFVSFALITETGLRVKKELLPMRKEQVDLAKMTAWIPDSKTANGIAEFR